MKIKGTEIQTVCFDNILNGGVFEDDGDFYIKTGISCNATNLCNGSVARFDKAHKVIAKKDAVMFVNGGEIKEDYWKSYFEQLTALTDKVKGLEEGVKKLSKFVGKPEE